MNVTRRPPSSDNAGEDQNCPARRNQPPVTHDRDSRRQAVGNVEIVGGEDDDRAITGQLSEAFGHDSHRAIVEPGEWLVEKNQFWPMQERSLQCQTLTHPARERRDVVVGSIGQAGAVERGVNCVPDVEAMQFGEESEVLPRRQLWIEVQLVREQPERARKALAKPSRVLLLHSESSPVLGVTSVAIIPM